jgi:hypothetical protein
MPHSDRDARLVLIGAFGALVAVAAAVLLALLLATSARAHACVGDWRVEQWQSVLEEGATLEVARLDLVPLPLCSTPDPDAAAPVTYSPPPPPAEIEAIIAAAFAGHPHVSVERATAIAWCESRYVPHAKNAHSTAGGIFQFLAGTWRYEAENFGFPPDPVNRFDPVLAAELASLVMERDGGPRQWSCKG